jgi:glycerophosphoryl diester phosphodiesterase
LVLEQINKYDVFERTNLQSFDLRILEEVKRQAPTMPVAVLIDGNENIIEKSSALSFTPEIISPYFQLLNQEEVKMLQSDGFQVIPWTVNDVSDMRRMIDYGVDAIITDYPDRLLALLSE